jgi:hypothetical protein
LHHRRRAALLFALGALAAAPRRAARAATADVGRVANRRGAVAAIRGSAIVPLAPGDPVYLLDIVRTGPEGRVLIVCHDGLQLAVGPGTELVLRSYLAPGPGGGLEAVLGLLRGIVRLIGGRAPGGGRIEVDTRTALASVRSTEWLVEVTGKGTGVLAIAGGEVNVEGLGGGRVVLRPGEGTDVAPGAAPRPPTRWGDPRRLDAIARTTL